MPSSLVGQAQENSAALQAIAHLGTAFTAFVGRTLRGPANRPVTLKSFAEFQHVFGGLWQPSPLGYAVEQFFDNGGREAVVVRVVNGARSATLDLAAGGGTLLLRAVQPGTREFLRACVDYDNIAPENTDEFNLTIQRLRTQGTQHVEDQEIFRHLTVRPGAKRSVADALEDSQLVRLAGAPPTRRPQRTLDAASGLATGYVHSNSDGDDGAPLTDYDVIGSATERTGLFALTAAEHFNFLCIPPLSREQDVGPSTLLVAVRFCREQRAMLIVDPPAHWHTVDDALRALRDWDLPSEDALMFFPRVLAHDKLRGRFESFTPCGAVAGLLARLDEQSPPWSGAAGEEPVLRPGFRPSSLVPEDRRAKLAVFGVNTLQSVRSAARVPVALRTLAAAAGGASDRRFLRARRLELFIVNSIVQGTRWAAQAPRTAELAAQVEAQVRAFFAGLRREGAFADRCAEDAFFVFCDRRVNGAEEPRIARFQLLIGFAAARVGEFHAYRITHTTAGSEVAPATLNRLKAAEHSPEEMQWLERLASELRPGS